MDNPTIILIADYGNGDSAFVEVMLQLRRLLPTAMIIPQSTPPFSTINTGFWIYQYALTPSLHNTYIYSNTAPRTEHKEAQVNNKGEKLMYAQLTNGFEIIAVNAGNSFSFVKPYIQDFYFATVENEGSQFRSRDKFPKAVYQMIMKDPALLGEKADLSIIPEAPISVIAHIDGYGNLKTTIRKSDISFESGQKIIITIGTVSHNATYTDGTFNIATGSLAFAPGSTGHDNRFMEIFLRGANAYTYFSNPHVEDAVIVIAA